jgi:glycosyltransferase involved in cell wall biosynthesis
VRAGLVWDARGLQDGFKAHKERGIGRYAKNLLRALAPLLAPGQLALLHQANLPEPTLPGGVASLNPAPLPAAYAPAWLPIGKRLLSNHLLVRRPLKEAWRGGKVTHFISHLDAPARIGPRTVLTVHDLIGQRMERLYRTGKTPARFRLERWLETRCLYQAAAIIAPSGQTRDDLVELYGIAPELIRVVPEAADPGLAPVEDPRQREEVLRRHGLETGRVFWLYLGGIDQRKDMGSLLKALAALQEQGVAGDLVMAGSIAGDKQHPALVAEIARLGLTERVRMLGFVPDADLPALFSACRAFVFPSLYEGFGLPPLEAMACGAPVVAVNASAVPEVVGDAGILVPPGDVAALAQALTALASIGELAAELRDKGRRRCGLFSWERAAERTLAVYEEASGERRPAS